MIQTMSIIEGSPPEVGAVFIKAFQQEEVQNEEKEI